MRDAFENVDPRDYKMTRHEDQLNFEITVRKNITGAKDFLVTLRKEKHLGSHFGTCTCGVPSKEGVPCKHMVGIVKSTMFEGMKRTDIMPYFWSTDHWKRQYNLASQHNTEIAEITTVKKACVKNEFLRYCPDWAVGAKKGRKKKEVRRKTMMDHVAEHSTKKRKRTCKMFCEICQKHNHKTEDCYHKTTNNHTCNEKDLAEHLTAMDNGTNNNKDGEVGAA